MGQYLDILAADAAGHHAEADAAFRALRKAQAVHPRLQARAAEVAIFSTVAQAVDAATRPCFDRDYGTYTGHPLDPRTDDSDDLTPDDARQQATDQILGHAESVADWMAKACDCDEGRIALDVSAVDAVQIIDGSPALLVAVLMTGDNTQALRALHKLRELAAKAFAPEIDGRAADLLAEGAL